MSPQCPPPMRPLAVWMMARRRHGLDFGSPWPALGHHEPPCVLGYHGGLGPLFQRYAALCCEGEAESQEGLSTAAGDDTARLQGQGLAQHWPHPALAAVPGVVLCHVLCCVPRSASKGQMPRILLHTPQELVNRQYLGHWAICDVATLPLPDGSPGYVLWRAQRSCELGLG